MNTLRMLEGYLIYIISMVPLDADICCLNCSWLTTVGGSKEALGSPLTDELFRGKSIVTSSIAVVVLFTWKEQVQQGVVKTPECGTVPVLLIVVVPDDSLGDVLGRLMQ